MSHQQVSRGILVQCGAQCEIHDYIGDISEKYGNKVDGAADVCLGNIRPSLSTQIFIQIVSNKK